MDDKTREMRIIPPQNPPRGTIAYPVFPREVRTMDVALIRGWLARAEVNLQEAERVPGMSEETLGYYKGYCTALGYVLKVSSESVDAREEAVKAANPPMPGWFPIVVVGTFCVGVLMVLGWALFS